MVKVIVLGGTSALSKAVVLGLSNSGGHKITILTTSDNLPTPELLEGTRIVKTDYSKDSLIAEFSGHDAVVSTLGGSASHLQSRAIEAALHSSVRRFIPSEFGIDTADLALMKLVYPLQKKIETQNHLKKLAADHPGFSYTLLSTGPWFDLSLSDGFLGIGTKDRSALLVDSGNSLFSASLLPDVGRAVAGILAQLDETKNKHLYIASLVINQTSILSALQEITAGKAWKVLTTTRAEQEALGTFQSLFFAGIYSDSARQDLSQNYKLSNSLLGLAQPRSDGIEAAKWAISQSSVEL